MQNQTPLFLHLKLPKGIIFTEKQLIEFREMNHKRVESTMKNGFFTLIIDLMGNFSKAVRFTAEIIRLLGNWNFEKRLGEVYTETQMYQVREHTYREADSSFVAFSKVSMEEQDSWFEKNANKSATLLIEISGTANNAKIDLLKTIEYWIPFGTDYVIVIDLENKKWHFFDHSANYSSHSFSEKFIAPNDLPNLIFDFDEIANRCRF